MTAQEFIFKTAPFKKIEGEEYKELYKELSNDNLSVDGYNPLHGIDTTYHLESYVINMGHGCFQRNDFEPLDENIRVMSFRCGRTSDILTLVVYCNTKEQCILKIGTSPSLRDFHRNDIKKYNKVLTEQQRVELITAVVIAGNGVGIGSYVYLRRIFESVVLEEAKRAISDKVITEEEFAKKSMDEKIVSIKDYLPAFLYDHHKELYGILSIGVHQLNEDDCLSFFPVLYDCIILILDDRLAQKEKEEATNKAAISLSKITATINNGRTNVGKKKKG